MLHPPDPAPGQGVVPRILCTGRRLSGGRPASVVPALVRTGAARRRDGGRGPHRDRPPSAAARARRRARGRPAGRPTGRPATCGRAPRTRAFPNWSGDAWRDPYRGPRDGTARAVGGLPVPTGRPSPRCRPVRCRHSGADRPQGLPPGPAAPPADVPGDVREPPTRCTVPAGSRTRRGSRTPSAGAACTGLRAPRPGVPCRAPRSGTGCGPGPASPPEPAAARRPPALSAAPPVRLRRPGASSCLSPQEPGSTAPMNPLPRVPPRRVLHPGRVTACRTAG